MLNTIIKLVHSDYCLKKMGYNFLENLSSVREVNLVENKDGIKTIIKRDCEGWYPQTLVENEILEKFSGLDMLPRKILFKEDVSEGIVQEYCPFGGYVLSYFLEEEYIQGKKYNYEQLSAKEEQKLINLVNNLHEEGYVRMEIERASNFIITPDGLLYYIDSGSCAKKDDPDFKDLMKKDLVSLDNLLKKSQGVKNDL